MQCQIFFSAPETVTSVPSLHKGPEHPHCMMPVGSHICYPTVVTPAAAWDLLRDFLLKVGIFWCATLSVWATSGINRHTLMHLKTIWSYYQTCQYIMCSDVQFVSFFVPFFCVLAVMGWYWWKEGCWVLNFEESWCHDLGGYEALPLVTLMVQVFLGCDIMSFGKYSDSWKDHFAYEDQELPTQLSSATSVKTWIW